MSAAIVEQLEKLITIAVDRAIALRLEELREQRSSGADTYMSTKGAGAVLHIGDREVRRLIKQGRLQATKRSAGHSGRLLVTRESVERFLKQGEL